MFRFHRSLTLLRLALLSLVGFVVLLALIFTSVGRHRCRHSLLAAAKTYFDGNVIGLVYEPDDDRVPPLFVVRPLVIWSANYHDAPLYDLIDLLPPLGARIINRNFAPSGYCEQFPGACNASRTLRVVGLRTNYLCQAADERRHLASHSFDAYRDDPEMAAVDAFLCYHPSSICAAFERFNKSLVVVPSLRYNNYACRTPDRWRAWNRRLVTYAADPKNIVGANNLYDVEFLRYFTGIDAQYLPSFCNYSGMTYRATSDDKATKNRVYLLWRRTQNERGWLNGRFRADVDAELVRRNSSARLLDLKTVYPDAYKMADVAAHPGIVNVPYDASTMSVFEHYRMNVPLFFPAKALLVDWHLEYSVLCYRGTRLLRCDHDRPLKRGDLRQHRSTVERFPVGGDGRAGGGTRGGGCPPDPNDDRSPTAVEYWLSLADFYQFPHITYFDSAADLGRILDELRPADLRRISRRMAEHNRRLKRELLTKWSANLLTIARYSANRPH